MQRKRGKAVALVAAHFVPSNLAAMHRARLWSLHLREFGWEPVIVTTHWDYYEETPELGLCELLPPDLRIVRTKGFRIKPFRLVGDIGVRGFWWHFRELTRMSQAGEIDFVHITIPSNFSAMLGRLVNKKTGLPYGIDYIDPWVHSFPGSDKPFTKAWACARLANILEPWAVKKASLITGINRQYYQGMLDRNPDVAHQAVLSEMPYGGSEKDHEYVRQHPMDATLFAKHVDKFNLVYAGAMLPKAYKVLDRLLNSVKLLREKRPTLSGNFHLHFIGTGKSPNDPAGFNIRPHVEHLDLLDCVSEYPHRMPYLDVLNHLHSASGILVLGSTEPHYSPSKIFQSVMSRKPIFAILHERSSGVPILEAAGAGMIIKLSESVLPSVETLAGALESFVYRNNYSEANVHWPALEKYSARASASALALALDEALTQQKPKWNQCE
jgi:hypothetical protein